jgi:predicted acylesterase/phospholipase RssA
MPDGQPVKFNDVFQSEVTVINGRRKDAEPPRPSIALSQESGAIDSTGEPVLTPNEDANVIGLALSGGGVRSSAFCLGALQALDEAKVLDRVDYLSSVSGGGYIGCSLSAGLEATRGVFPFKPDAVEDETPSMQHIRDHSNYFFPAAPSICCTTARSTCADWWRISCW